jgi:hypothetical protein
MRQVLERRDCRRKLASEYVGQIELGIGNEFPGIVPMQALSFDAKRHQHTGKMFAASLGAGPAQNRTLECGNGSRIAAFRGPKPA